MATTKVIHKILNGPSREELFDALRLCTEDRTVEFFIKRPEENGTDFPDRIRIEIGINSIQVCISKMNDLGYRWIVVGWISAAQDLLSLPADLFPPNGDTAFAGEDFLVEMIYNTKTRKGSMTSMLSASKTG